MSKPQKNWLEWGVFAVGCLLVFGTVGYLAYDAWTGNGKPPTLEVQLGKAEPRAGHYALPVTVVNRGDESAEQVHVQVVLKKKNGQPERADFQIAFVPRQASRKGWVTFESDPADAERITARPLGYERP